RVLRLGQNLDERGLVEVLERGDHRQAADELGDEAKLEQVLRLDLAEEVAGATIIWRCNRGAETDRGLAATIRDDLLQAGEGTAAADQDVGRVDLQGLLLRVLAAALRRHRGYGAFHDLEQRLLDALARHVARDRRVVRLAADLVDLVDVDD